MRWLRGQSVWAENRYDPGDITISTYAIVWSYILSYTAIYAYTALLYHHSLIPNIFQIQDFKIYHFLTGDNMKFMYEISFRFEITDCICKVSWYVDWIDNNGYRKFHVVSRGSLARDAPQHLRSWHRLKCTVPDCSCNQSWQVHPTQVNSSGAIWKLIAQAKWPVNASVTMSVKVCFYGFIPELESHQLWHSWISICYILIV